MPLLRIDITEGRSPAQIRSIADAVHDAVVAVLRVPARDRFQIVNEVPAGRIIAEDAGLGFERQDAVMIQVFTQRGRSTEVKSALFAAIAANLAEVGVPGEDVFIGYVENGPDDWSFGHGVAQYVTGELGIPAR